MVKPKNREENAKSRRWKVPVTLEGVKPSEYPETEFAPKPQRSVSKNSY